MDILLERAPRTIFLFLTATLLEFILGYWLGKVLAWTRGSAVEYSITVLGAFLYTIFVPWFALMMIYFFGFTLKWVPIGKFLDVSLWRQAPIDSNYIFINLLVTASVLVVAVVTVLFLTRKMNVYKAKWINTIAILAGIVIAIGVWAASPYGKYAGDVLYHMVLPIMTLTIVNFSGTMLLTRTTMLETLREDYVMAARAKGLPEREVRDRHAARNALLPVFTALVISLPFILGGGIITETVFSWEGLGLTLLQASTTGDIPMVMGSFLFIGSLALIAHMVADVMYAFLDPRIRYS